jgi:hypothetical protein
LTYERGVFLYLYLLLDEYSRKFISWLISWHQNAEDARRPLEEGLINENILLSGFGKFCVKVKLERRGRNFQTENDLRVDSRRVVIFRTSGVLNRKLNKEKN